MYENYVAVRILRPFSLQLIRTGLEKGPVEGYEAEAKVQCIVNVHVGLQRCPVG